MQRNRGFPLDPSTPLDPKLADLPYVSVPKADAGLGDAWRMVVPATVLKVSRSLGGPAQVRFSYKLYHHVGQVDLAIASDALCDLQPGSRAYLIAAYANGMVRLTLEPTVAAAAIDSALAAAHDDDVPLAEVADLPNVPSPPVIRCEFRLSPQEAQEGSSLGQMPPTAPEPKKAQGLLGWIVFIVLCVGLFTWLHFNTRKDAPAIATEAMPPKAASAWQAAGRAAGAALAVGGMMAAILGTRCLRQLRSQCDPVSAAITDSSLIVRFPGGETVAEWAAFERLMETPNLFILHGRILPLAIPKRVLDGDAQHALRCMLRRHVPPTGCFQ